MRVITLLEVVDNKSSELLYQDIRYEYQFVPAKGSPTTDEHYLKLAQLHFISYVKGELRAKSGKYSRVRSKDWFVQGTVLGVLDDEDVHAT